MVYLVFFFFSSRRRHTRCSRDWSSDVCSSDLPRDRMALVTDDVKLLVDFTGEMRLLKTKLDSLKARAMSGWLGSSKQYDALMATLNELFSKEDQRPIIILQTDGEQLDDLSPRLRLKMLEPY